MYAFLRQFDEFGQFVEIKRRAFCRALDFDDFAFAVHHNVDVAVAAQIFGIIQIQQRAPKLCFGHVELLPELFQAIQKYMLSDSE